MVLRAPPRGQDQRVGWMFTFTAAYNLVRIRNLMRAPTANSA